MDTPKPSAKRVSITPLPSARALVTIDDGEEMTLEPIIWKLLIALALDPEVDAGPLVDWKKPEEIRRDLEKRMERRITPRSIKQNILRLRNALDEAGYSRWLVECKKDCGYRFRLLRPEDGTRGS